MNPLKILARIFWTKVYSQDGLNDWRIVNYIEYLWRWKLYQWWRKKYGKKPTRADLERLYQSQKWHKKLKKQFTNQ